MSRFNDWTEGTVVIHRGPEQELLGDCEKMWRPDDFGFGSMKTPPLTDKMKRAITAIADDCNVAVRYTVEDRQHYIEARRVPKKKGP